MPSSTSSHQTNPHFWTLKERLNWQQQGLFQPFPKLSEEQFTELLAAEGEELRHKWRFLSPEFRMQMLTPPQREWLMESCLNLNLELLPVEQNAQLPETALNGSSPISNWFLFSNQSVTPDERKAALQRIEEQKNIER